MTPRLSCTHTGSHPSPLTCIVSSSTPNILGMLGPQISVSMSPLVREGFDAKAKERSVLKVDLPTPPLPERTRILCRTEERRSVMRGMSGSGPLGAEAQIFWLGYPAHESATPACVDSGPGQCSM